MNDELFQILSMKLCDDVAFHILEIFHTMKIQRRFRKWMYRHTRRFEWNELRRMILKIGSLNKKEFDILQTSYRIRKEWCQEPTSWIYMLKYEKECIVTVVEEVSLRI